MKLKGNLFYTIFISFLFLLCNRFISIYYFNNIDSLNSIYTTLSKIVAVFIFFIAFIQIIQALLQKEAMNKLNIGVTVGLLFIGASLLFSTLINGGDLQRCIMILYPILSINLLVILCCHTEHDIKRFIYAISNLFFLLVLINLIFILVSPGSFGPNTYFIGIKNQLGSPLCIGFLFCHLDNYFNGHKIKYFIYAVMFFATILIIFSGSNVVMVLLIAICLFIPPVRALVKKMKLSFFNWILIGVLIVIASGAVYDILNTPYISSFLYDVLGKNATLTDRTYIWTKVMEEVINKPIFGHGIKSSGDLFYIHIVFTNKPETDNTFSAHNQFLQSLYEGGAALVAVIFGYVFFASKKLSKCYDEKITLIFKVIIISVMVLMLSEAAGLDTILFLVSFAAIVSQVMINHNHTEKRRLENYNEPTNINNNTNL